jgi:hypothetical protein
MFALRFPAEDIARWAKEYNYRAAAADPTEVGTQARRKGEIGLSELQTIAKWKSPRSAGHCVGNTDIYVRTVTSAAFSSDEPRFKIEVLCLLDGVDWPTASVILHFCDAGKWPVMDWRAFWSLKAPPPAGRYSFELWWAYTEACRRLADEGGHDMRTVDRALWAYSKAKQR